MLLDAKEKQAAEWFLAMFSPPVARQGKQCYAQGAFGMVWLGREGSNLKPVKEARGYGRTRTELHFENGQWDAVCSCKRDQCVHGYAAMLAVLGHSGNGNGNGAARVSSGEKDEKAARPPGESLGEVLAARLGRPLRPAEREITRCITAFQEKLKSGQPLSFRDFEGLIEIYWHLPNFEPLRPKAGLPPLEFWQEFALHCVLQKVVLPPLMDPLTDKAAIEHALEGRRRQEEIERWKQTLAQAPRWGVPEAAATVDLALMIAPPQVQVLAQTSPGGGFKKLGGSGVQNLMDRVAEGTQSIHPEALPIFTGFLGANNTYSSSYFSLDQAAVRCVLAQLLRIPGMESRLLTVDHEPYRRGTVPFEWKLTETDDGYYKLQLTDGTGKLAPKNAVVLPGNPCLYLTESAVFEGPPKPRELTVTTQRIPGPALESQEGLALLAALRLPVPGKIQARTRQVRMDVVIRCKLRTPNYSTSEQCHIEFLAGSVETGLRERYAGSGWAPISRQEDRAEFFYVFDRASLDAVPGMAEALGASWDHFENVWRVRVTRNFPEKFLEWHAQIPSRYTFELDPELASLIRDPVKARVTLECEEAGVDWFDLRTTVNVDDTTLTPEEIKLLLNAKGKAVRLKGKGWRRLEYQLTEDEDQSLARLGLSPRDFSAEPQRLHALQLADRAAEGLLAAEQYQRIRQRAGEIKTRVTPPLPATVTATLRPYQTEGFHFLSYLSENHFGGILADDMGLGKTVQTLTWLEWLRARQPAAKPSLVVCPKSVMENWRSEAAKFAPGLKVEFWRGFEGSSMAATARQHDLMVLNYAQLRSLADNAAAIPWLAVILDEAQYIKNPDSQTAQAARALRADHRLALSGTPIENRLLDLWSLMAFAMPGILGNRAEFRRRFDQQGDPFARRRLSARVRPFLLRRTKNQVASELPDRIEEDMVCELEGAQKTLYRAEFKRAQQLLLKVQTQAELNEFRFHFLTSLLRLRQICCHPALVDDEHKEEESAKLNALMDLLEPLMEEGYKVLVFSQFVEMLQIIRERVVLQKWKHFYLDGSSEDRGNLVQSFQDHAGPAVFLISLKAGGFGLNLTAASYVVLYDPWWNPAVENQAIDRTHRIGQTQKVIAYRLLAKDSIEQKIRALQRQKSTLAENVLGDESFAASLTIDDLRFLFEDDEARD